MPLGCVFGVMTALLVGRELYLMLNQRSAGGPAYAQRSEFRAPIASVVDAARDELHSLATSTERVEALSLQALLDLRERQWAMLRALRRVNHPDSPESGEAWALPVLLWRQQEALRQVIVSNVELARIQLQYLKRETQSGSQPPALVQLRRELATIQAADAWYLTADSSRREHIADSAADARQPRRKLELLRAIEILRQDAHQSVGLLDSCRHEIRNLLLLDSCQWELIRRQIADNAGSSRLPEWSFSEEYGLTELVTSLPTATDSAEFEAAINRQEVARRFRDYVSAERDRHRLGIRVSSSLLEDFDWFTVVLYAVLALVLAAPVVAFLGLRASRETLPVASKRERESLVLEGLLRAYGDYIREVLPMPRQIKRFAGKARLQHHLLHELAQRTIRTDNQFQFEQSAQIMAFQLLLLVEQANQCGEMIPPDEAMFRQTLTALFRAALTQERFDVEASSFTVKGRLLTWTPPPTGATTPVPETLSLSESLKSDNGQRLLRQLHWMNAGLLV